MFEWIKMGYVADARSKKKEKFNARLSPRALHSDWEGKPDTCDRSVSGGCNH